MGSRGASAWPAILCALAASCFYDADERCGPHQEYDGDRCICAPGYGLFGTRCLACGEHEVGSLSGCSCEPGYSRPTPQSPCEEQGTLGQACQQDGDCQHPVFTYCHIQNGAGYCTRPNCSDSSQCETSIDYSCNTRATPSFCERPPSGLGTTCSKDSDCAGFDASYCEALSAKVCLPKDCKSNLDKCHGDWVCCDIPLLRESICIPPSELEAGACPVGGTLISRSGGA